MFGPHAPREGSEAGPDPQERRTGHEKGEWVGRHFPHCDRSKSPPHPDRYRAVLETHRSFADLLSIGWCGDGRPARYRNRFGSQRTTSGKIVNSAAARSMSPKKGNVANAMRSSGSPVMPRKTKRLNPTGGVTSPISTTSTR